VSYLRTLLLASVLAVSAGGVYVWAAVEAIREAQGSGRLLVQAGAEQHAAGS
jgi:hypothetical protein